MLLTVSHGNATVESGFSINEALLLNNMKERTVIAQRTVYDSIIKHGGVLNVPIKKELINRVRGSHSSYQVFLEEQKKHQTQSFEEVEKEKDQVVTAIRAKEIRKRQLEEELEKEIPMSRHKFRRVNKL